MRYRIAVEDIEPNHHVAWILDLPACFSPARTREEAIARAPERIGGYFAWLAGHDGSLPVVEGPIEVEVAEVFQAHASEEDPDYLVNAFFADDRRPLTYWEVVAALRLLCWTREDLLDVVRPLSPQQLSQPVPDGGVDSISAILKHVARAENWYLGQLGLELPRAALDDDTFAGLEAVRAQTRAQLPALIGDERITEYRGESWSARKVLRRTLWHERDHTQHIARLASGLRKA